MSSPCSKLSPNETPTRTAANSDRTSALQQRFGTPPRLWCRAPGRVDLMGSHTDYNLGCRAHAADRPRHLDRRPPESHAHGQPALAEPRCRRVVFARFQRDRTRTSRGSITSTGWRWCCRRKACRLTGFDGVIHSTVPVEQRPEFLRGARMRRGHRVRGARRMATRSAAKGPAVPARRKPLRRRQLRHPRPIHLVHGPGRMRPAARLPRPVQPSRWPSPRASAS